MEMLMGIHEDLEDIIKNDLQYIFSVTVIFKVGFMKKISIFEIEKIFISIKNKKFKHFD